MKIYTATAHFVSSIRELFRGHDVEVLPQNFDKVKGDLLVFTGGEDINPKLYGGTVPPQFWNAWHNDKRDAREAAVFRALASNQIIFPKVLGICRGLQFLNVMNGGNLVYDIRSSYGDSHKHFHPITWSRPNIFSSVEVVNSLHHQGIHRLGDNLRPTILGVEPQTHLIEACLWGNHMLAFQFHPELLPEGKDKLTFSEGIVKWAEGKAEIVTGAEIPQSRKKSAWDYEEALARLNSNNRSGRVIRRDPSEAPQPVVAQFSWGDAPESLDEYADDSDENDEELEMENDEENTEDW